MSRRRRTKADADEPLAGPPPKPARCVARTATGARCKRNAMPGADRCPQHLGGQPRSPGRPTRLTKDVVEEILDILRVGGYAETAAAAVGISPRTWQHWIKRGDPDGTKQADRPYREFREQVEQAVAEGEAACVAAIRQASAKDWKAAAWMLERQQPDKWAGPRGRGLTSSVHPDDFAAGETSGKQDVIDDQVGPDGRAL
jgi:hypothetical protein